MSASISEPSAGPASRTATTSREDALHAYAQATGGGTAGPVFAIVPAWETIPAASRSVASDDARRRIVHAAQDIHVHAPIEAGMSLVTTATPIGLFARRSGAALVIRAETRDDGRLVAEQYVTELFRGLEAGEDRGEPAPDVPAGAREGEPRESDLRGGRRPGRAVRARRPATTTRSTSTTRRHGRSACPGASSTACARWRWPGGAVEQAAGRAPTRLAVRFSAPVALGATVTTRVWRADGALAFEATVRRGHGAQGRLGRVR